MRAAVVGHVEWIRFARVDHVPAAGEIAHSFDEWEQAGGGGGVAAVQLALLADEAHLFTALGNDELGRRARSELESRGVTFLGDTIDSGVCHQAIFLDPAGNQLDLHHRYAAPE